MEERSVFDRLVKSLSSDDRAELLNKIQRSVTLSYEPLNEEVEETGGFDPFTEISSLNSWQRLLLFLKSIFTKKDKITLIEETCLKRLGAQIEKRNRGLIDYRRSLFTEKMFFELSLLKDGLALLRRPFTLALGEKKSEFFAFLASTELEYLQEKLINETDPFTIWKSIRASDEVDVRNEMLNRFNDLLDAVPKADKNRVDQDAHTLFSLHALSSHSFDTMLSRFKPEPSSGSKVCEFRKLRNDLISLAELLNAAQYTPSNDALQSLYLFNYQDRLDGEDFNIEDQLKNDLMRFERILTGIREFNQRVHLIHIIRYITADLDYYTEEIGGGEDWFLIYKDFWRHRIDRAYTGFVKYITYQKLTEEAVNLLNRNSLPELSAYKSEHFGKDIKALHSLSISFLRGFMQSSFNTMYRPLKLIFLNGEFYKDDNREDFTDTFNFLSKIDEKINTLENRLNPKGDLDTAIQNIRNDIINSQLKRKKIKDILTRADKDALSIINDCCAQMLKLTQLLGGILQGEPGARFDTLSNLDTIGGAENKSLIASWAKAKEKIEQAQSLLINIKDLELQG